MDVRNEIAARVAELRAASANGNERGRRCRGWVQRASRLHLVVRHVRYVVAAAQQAVAPPTGSSRARPRHQEGVGRRGVVTDDATSTRVSGKRRTARYGTGSHRDVHSRAATAWDRVGTVPTVAGLPAPAPGLPTA